MKGSVINKKWFVFLVISLIWLAIFLDKDGLSFNYKLFDATSVVFCMTVTFFIGKYYLPRLKQDSRYRYQFFILCLLIIFTVSILDFITDRGRELEDVESYPFIVDVLFEVFNMLTDISIPLVFSWVYVITQKREEDQLAISKLEALNKEAALSALRNQINPHFLFNALSNIYSIAYLGDKRTPDKIMQLSKMLRYVIYDCNKERVSIDKELRYIKDYIDFQRFRIKKKQNIYFNVDCDTNYKIAPMVLQTFIENAFKHSNISIVDDAWVSILLKTEKEKVIFCVENTISDVHGSSSELEEKSNGVGLDNIRKRLDLVYDDKYKLKISNDDIFKIELIITIDKDKQ